MVLGSLDLTIVLIYLALTMVVGLLVARRAGKSSSQFFLSGRDMPWWLLGFSMVATTFATDTPNLVTDLVRSNGVSGNWVWWAFLLTGMLTVFIYARLWRRSGVVTDVEFYELRYSGPTAAFLRGFRAVYLGFFFNVLVLASVTLAAIKIAGVMLGIGPLWVVLVAGTVTVIFSAAGGLRAVLITDVILFFVAMVGSVAAAYVALGHPEVGGLSGLLTHPEVEGKLSIFPDFSDPALFIPLFLIPLAVQWWSVWYPGAEPGGGGYVAQRMLSARNENHAVGAVLLFNCAHYALRPWPWIIVALCSLAVYPTLDSLRDAFPHVAEGIIRDDMAYPAMLTFLPAGLLGLVVASLAAAYMSTVSTQLNWGSSYLVNDFWARFFKPNATEREKVVAGRIFTVAIMVVGAGLALILEQAVQAFNILLTVGAGTGLIFILRWFWWRINALSELAAMVVSFVVALGFFFYERAGNETIAGHWQMVAGVAITTACWLTVAFVTKPVDQKTLRSFYRLTAPGGPGWQAVRDQAKADNDPIEEPGAGWQLPLGILCMFLGCVAVYSVLFATGYWLYGQYIPAIILSVIAVVSSWILWSTWLKMSREFPQFVDAPPPGENGGSDR